MKTRFKYPMRAPSVIAVGLSVFTAGAVLAQSGSSKPDFRQLDANGDAQISVTEAEQHRPLLEQFTALDANNDGLLSRMEFAEFGKQKQKK